MLVTKKNNLNKTEIEQTIIGLDKVLVSVEKFNSICNACEIIDLNKYKIITNRKQVAFYVTNKQHKKFVFICNKN